jgi:hypothetical protein
VDALRSQDLVLSTDALPGGTIKKWEWFASATVTPGTFNNFKIKLCHTSRSALSRDFAANYDGNTPAEVYSRAVQAVGPTPYTWFGFAFDADFEYNGKKNLIYEVSWNGDSGGNAYTYWSPGTARCIVSQNGAAANLYNYIHYMRITLEPSAVSPTSVGRVKALFR